MLQLDGIEVAMDSGPLRASFELAPGARVAVVGPSGAGKSTLLDAIAGFRPLTKGRVLWHGKDIGKDAPSKRPMSILFQDGNLFPHLTVSRNLALAVRPDGWRPSTAQQADMERALSRVGLDGFGNRMPATLSGGQRSRVALARVLLQARPVLLLDEPFAALGPAMKNEMLDLVQEITTESGALVLLVTHDPKDAARFAQEIVLVENGRVENPAPTANFLNDPPEAFRTYLGDTSL